MLSKDFCDQIERRAKGEVKFKLANLMTLAIGYQYLAETGKIAEKAEFLARAHSAEKEVLEICQSNVFL